MAQALKIFAQLMDLHSIVGPSEDGYGALSLLQNGNIQRGSQKPLPQT
jgi:hypothetical protein